MSRKGSSPRLAGAVDGVPEALLRGLRDKADAAAHLQDRRAYSWISRGSLLKFSIGSGRVKKERKSSQVLLLDDDHDLLDPGVERLLDDQQDRGLGDAVAVDDGEQLLLDRLGGREEPRAEAGGRDERRAGPWGPCRSVSVQRRQPEVALEDLDHGLLVGLAPGDELRRAVALRSDALATPDVRLQGLVREHPVQDRRRQFRGAGGGGVAVEERLRLGHQGAEARGVPGFERGPSPAPTIRRLIGPSNSCTPRSTGPSAKG